MLDLGSVTGRMIITSSPARLDIAVSAADVSLYLSPGVYSVAISLNTQGGQTQDLINAQLKVDLP